MKKNDYGVCEVCSKPLIARHFTFNRHVERCHYGQNESDDGVSIEVLRAEDLSAYCSRECAWPAIMSALAERGVRHTGSGVGPIEVCAKCGGPVLMSEPHIAYNVHDETEQRKPWLKQIEVHESEALADVCVRCDGDVAADAANLPESIEFEALEMLDAQLRVGGGEVEQ
jgi:hypothetical protein